MFMTQRYLIRFLVDILVNGIVDEAEIRAALDQSTYFVSGQDEPAWRTVWQAFERTDDEFHAAYERMEEQFATHNFVRAGEILQVFGLRLWLVERGILAQLEHRVLET